MHHHGWIIVVLTLGLVAIVALSKGNQPHTRQFDNYRPTPSQPAVPLP